MSLLIVSGGGNDKFDFGEIVECFDEDRKKVTITQATFASSKLKQNLTQFHFSKSDKTADLTSVSDW